MWVRGGIFLAVTLLSACKSQPKERWAFVTSTGDSEYTIDRQTLTKAGPQVTVWVKQKWYADQEDKHGFSYDEELARWTYDCAIKKKTLLTVSWRYHDAPMRSIEDVQPDVENVMPETYGEEIMNAACDA